MQDISERAAITGIHERRTPRLDMGVPIRVYATDLQGKDFVEDAITVAINLHGARIRLGRELIVDQEIRILSGRTGRAESFRVVDKVEHADRCTDWGVECTNRSDSIWGISFPRLFTEEDEQLLDALGSQSCNAHDNSRLFEEVRSMKNYNDSILRTMATGVITLDPEGGVKYSNVAGLKIFSGRETFTPGQPYDQFFNRALNPEITIGIETALREGKAYTGYELQYRKPECDAMSVNLHVLPLQDSKGTSLGIVIIADDISQEQRLMTNLCRYVTRHVAEQIFKDRDDRLKLGGNPTVVTVLFSDIRNFTTISEQSSGEEIVAMLNDYFPHMLAPVFKNQGMLDKFIGDAMMAVFGTPVPREDDAERAVRAALDMRRALRKYNTHREAKGLLPIETGIGITKGAAISGNIGSEQRMDFTVIGDTVNIASRLEGLTKNYPYKILINEEVYMEIKDKIPCVDLGMAQVKGKEDYVHIYGVIDPGH